MRYFRLSPDPPIPRIIIHIIAPIIAAHPISAKAKTPAPEPANTAIRATATITAQPAMCLGDIFDMVNLLFGP